MMEVVPFVDELDEGWRQPNAGVVVERHGLPVLD
jgi:hypothetical protein